MKHVIKQSISQLLRLGKTFKVLALVLSMVTLLLSQSSSALATSIVHDKVVSANPADFTPNINDGVVNKLHQVGNIMIAGGNFKTVTHKKVTYQRSNLVSFNADTGTLTSLNASFDAQIWALTSQGDNLYVGGDFKQVNGINQRGVAKFNLSTGKLDTAFKSPLAWGKVRELGVTHGQLIIGGTFEEKLMSANLITGAKTNYLKLAITGSVTPAATDTRVYRFAIDPSETHLVAIGNFTSVNGQKRYRAFMIELYTKSVGLSKWYYPPLEDSCRSNTTLDYVRDVDFAPNGNYFVIVSSGWVAKPDRVGIALCDTAARFNTRVLNPTRPYWQAHTGGDTLHSVAISGKAIYLQGHNRYLNNPKGVDFAGPGALSRPGTGSLDPSTGLANSWNPGKQRGVGGKDTLVTAKGVWLASDTELIGGEVHKRIAFFPL